MFKLNSPLFSLKSVTSGQVASASNTSRNNQGEYLISRSSFVFINAWGLKEAIKDIKKVVEASP